MSYTKYYPFVFGPSKTGLSTCGYRIYDTAGSAVAIRVAISSGAERAPGTYAVSIALTDGFSGEIRGDTGDATIRYSSNYINPGDDEYTDAKISSVVASSGSGAYAVTITVTDGATALQNAKVRMTEGVNTFVAQTNVSGVASFSLDAATYTITITKAGYTFTPTTLAISAAGNTAKTMTAITVTPPSDPSLCNVFGFFIDPVGEPYENADFLFTLRIDGMSVAESIVAGRTVEATTDSDGALTDMDGTNAFLPLVRNDSLTGPTGSQWHVKSEAARLDKNFELADTTFDLSTLL